MPEPNVTVVATHPVWSQDAGADPRGASMASEVLGAPMVFPVDLARPPEYWVYLYTVSKLEFVVERAPLIRRLIVPASKPGERFRLVARIPHPFPQVEIDPMRGDWLVHDRGPGHDGRRVAQDICFPDNTTLEQDAYLRVQNFKPLSYGTNLSAQGVFWSLSNPPEEAEVAAAENRRHLYYKELWDQANALWTSEPKALQDIITRDHHAAAEYFGVDVGWHQIPKRFVECPNCGEKVREGVAFHRNEAVGAICVLDWRRAVQAGVKSPKQAKDAGFDMTGVFSELHGERDGQISDSGASRDGGV